MTSWFVDVDNTSGLGRAGHLTTPCVKRGLHCSNLLYDFNWITQWTRLLQSSMTDVTHPLHPGVGVGGGDRHMWSDEGLLLFIKLITSVKLSTVGLAVSSYVWMTVASSGLDIKLDPSRWWSLVSCSCHTDYCSFEEWSMKLTDVSMCKECQMTWDWMIWGLLTSVLLSHVYSAHALI